MDVMAFISSMLAAGIRMGIPIAFAGIGVVIAEKSGVLNIGCEGEMLTGSFVTFVVVYFTHSYFLGILAGGAGGLLTAMIISFLSITRKQDQSVVGIVVNIFAAGFTSASQPPKARATLPALFTGLFSEQVVQDLALML